MKVFRCGPLRNVGHPALRRPALENLPRWKPRGLGAVYGESAVGWRRRLFVRLGWALGTTSRLGQDEVGIVTLALMGGGFPVAIDAADPIKGTALARRSSRLFRVGP